MHPVGYILAMSQLSPEDRVAISELMGAYCHAIDLGRWDELPEMFTSDCRLDFGRLMGVFEGTEGVRRFADTLRGIGIFMRHFTTNIVVRGDGDRARAESYVLAVTGAPGSSAQTTGRYEDELVKVAGRWRIRVRRALLDTPA
jgi:SnoaL-like protein